MFYLLGVIIGLVISFLITALLIWILAMCFGFMFTWKLALTETCKGKIAVP